MGEAWRNMTRQDWQQLQQRMLGANASTHNHHGWSPLAVIVTLGAVLVMGLAIIAVIRRPPRRPPAAA